MHNLMTVPDPNYRNFKITLFPDDMQKLHNGETVSLPSEFVDANGVRFTYLHEFRFVAEDPKVIVGTAQSAPIATDVETPVKDELTENEVK